MTELIPLGIAIVTIASARRVLQAVTDTVIACPICGAKTNLGTPRNTRLREQMTAIALDHAQHANAQ